jgi:hypothetical protein
MMTKTTTNETQSNVLDELMGDGKLPTKAKTAKKPAAESEKAKPAEKAKAKAKAKPTEKVAKAPLAASKQADFIAAMKTAKGISIAEAVERFGWQPHTVRGAVAGALKKKLGLAVEAERDEKRGTVYRIK